MSGFVSLVGGGPGDPGLITVAGRDRLTRCDVIVYDRLIDPVLLDYVPAKAERIFAGKSPESKALTQEEINDVLVQKGLAGKQVVRLKGGDPFVFGRGGEEALALAKAGVPFEVIPGITSAIAAPAYAGVPVTHRRVASSFAVVTGHEDEDKADSSVDWQSMATAVDTIVVLMGAAALPGVSRRLIEGGRASDTPAISVEWGTTTRQRSVSATLETLADNVRSSGLRNPLLTVIGGVASLREHLAWFENRPLFGKRVLVTRTRAQASALSDLLRHEGAVPVELPALELQPVATDGELETMARDLEAHKFDWCLFTSTNAIDHVMAYLDRTGRDVRVFAGCKLVALGSATAAALTAKGLRPDLTASEFTSAGIVAAMPLDIGGQHVLLPRAEGGVDIGTELRAAKGAIIHNLTLYRSAAPASPDPEILQQIRGGEIDVATFASSSSIRNLAQLLGDDFEAIKHTLVASIGPVTTATAREYGLDVSVEPSTHTVPALVEALKAHFA
jgi:uroporphyrinogen III methyltransferase/synthase